jgi:hypothetical protein
MRMGEIIFWTIVRIVFVIPAMWVLQGYIDFNFWWLVNVLVTYGVIIHPAVVHYRLFVEKNKSVIESSLCSTCIHFDESAVLCMKYDKHPTAIYLPCEGTAWEPRKTSFKK